MLKSDLKIILDNLSLFRYNTRMKKYERKPWTDSERKVLGSFYFTTPFDKVCLLLAERSPASIRNQVHYLKKRGYRFKYENKSEE